MPNHSLLVRSVLFYSLKLPEHPGKWRVVNSLCDSLGLRVAGNTVEQRQGLWWNLDPSDYVQQDVFWLGDKDRWETYHLLRLAGPDSVFFDVGANFGYYALYLASRLGPGSTVHAFEPHPVTFQRLRENLQLNHLKNVITHRLALADRRGHASLQERTGNTGASYLIDGDGVEVTTLDDFCREQRIERLDVMKIDVEGAEERLLEGGRETLARLKPTLLVELNPPTYTRSGTSVARVAGLLGELGYNLFQLDRKRLAPLTQLPDGVNYVNALCIHRDRSIASRIH